MEKTILVGLMIGVIATVVSALAAFPAMNSVVFADEDKTKTGGGHEKHGTVPSSNPGHGLDDRNHDPKG
jgi:hypothetical protein